MALRAVLVERIPLEGNLKNPLPIEEGGRARVFLRFVSRFIAQGWCPSLFDGPTLTVGHHAVKNGPGRRADNRHGIVATSQRVNPRIASTCPAWVIPAAASLLSRPQVLSPRPYPTHPLNVAGTA